MFASAGSRVHALKLIVVSPENDEPREYRVLGTLLREGLQHYHLRKPTWDRMRIAAWLRELPSEYHTHIVLHSHHELVAEFGVGGLHERDCCVARNLADAASADAHGTDAGSADANSGASSVDKVRLRSRAVHDLSSLRNALEDDCRVLFSPVFPSISKVGYFPRVAHEDLKSILAISRTAQVIALGGIDSARVPFCRELGFDGVAVLGAIWQSSDPVCAFRTLQQACIHANAA